MKIKDMYYNQDIHIKKNSIKAVEYYKRAANKGEVISCLNLGTMYALGDGVEKDMSKAFFYWKISSDKGCVHAMYTLGINLLQSEVLDAIQGYKVLTSAAELGNKLAQ